MVNYFINSKFSLLSTTNGPSKRVLYGRIIGMLSDWWGGVVQSSVKLFVCQYLRMKETTGLILRFFETRHETVSSGLKKKKIKQM